ncbi:MAG TPA: MFS transporter, partial [Hyphomicrobium sp.]|nr:MFS transporter [Hyphomicrobium sp.]
MFARLLSSRRFAPLFWSQLLAALNDNLLKNALAMLVIYKLAMESGPALGTLAGAALVLPFFLFSALAGQLADKFDKAQVATRVRLMEIPIAVVAAAGFLIPSVPLLFVALILFGTLSAFFGPVKYGLLPSHLEVKELPSGNALIEGATFIAILIGTVGGNFASGSRGELIAVACAIIGISVLGWLFARHIPPAPSSAPDLKIDKNIVTSTITLLKDLRSDRRIWQGALITSWFWLVGAGVLALLQNLIPQVLNGAPSVYTLALFTFAVAVAFGSVIAARASSN